MFLISSAKAIFSSRSVALGLLAVLRAFIALSFHLIVVCTDPLCTASGITPACFFISSRKSMLSLSSIAFYCLRKPMLPFGERTTP
jgi:hypothetical protein